MVRIESRTKLDAVLGWRFPETSDGMMPTGADGIVLVADSLRWSPVAVLLMLLVAAGVVVSGVQVVQGREGRVGLRMMQQQEVDAR